MRAEFQDALQRAYKAGLPALTTGAGRFGDDRAGWPPLHSARSGKTEGRADAVLDEGAGQPTGDRVGGPPAGAVSRHHHVGSELLQGGDGVPDDRL